MASVSGRLKTLLTIHMVIHFLLLTTGVDGLRLDINPEKCTATMEDNVQLSCVPDGLNEDLVNEITLIKISRNDEKEPIVFLSHCSNVTYGTGMEQTVQGEGYIGKDFGNSFLNLTFTDPRSEDTGIYTCVMFYVDTSGDLKKKVTSGNLIVEKLDVKSLETSLNDLKNSMKDLQRRVSCVSAFSVATDTKNLDFPSSAVLILPKVFLKLGQGYEEKTGVFTAPWDGLYTFHLAVFSKPNCVTYLYIKANDKVLGRLYANDQNNWDQSAISVFAELRVGDKVVTLFEKGGCTVHNNQYTMFSGSLITAF